MIDWMSGVGCGVTVRAPWRTGDELRCRPGVFFRVGIKVGRKGSKMFVRQCQ